MMTLLEAALLIPALAAFGLAAFLLIEIIGALLPVRLAPAGAAPSMAVIVPAHNEADTIEPTLRGIKAQLRPGDRLLVVADNCTDRTAEIAMRAGATVLIRSDPDRRGKGYALQFALDALNEAPPRVAVFVDADCRLGDGALTRLAGAAAASGRPAQALYLMRAPEGAPSTRAVAAFAWAFMNRVRMAGLYTLFDVCRLTGSGMAFPWTIAEKLDLASGEIVEDLALSTSLSEAGAPPLFCLEARVESEFPIADDAAAGQRARWELGSLRFAARRAPGLFFTGLGKGDVRLVAAALDLAVPPLTVFAGAVLALVLLCALASLTSAEPPMRLAVGAGLLLAASVALGWIVFGRNILPPSMAGEAFAYVADKAKVYGARGRAAAAKWTRTRRDGEAPADDESAGGRE